MNDHDDAKLRFFIISALRLAGFALMMVGMLATAGKLGMPRPAGIAFMILGLLELLVLPPFLLRKWKSPEQ